jgi:2,4-dienoyl-CoA reductase-like NADH-dependent reductase (Old Yellow Enzyme family)
VTSPFDTVGFAHGPTMANRFMLAPLTNQQSHLDGTLSDEEFRWLTYRAEGGFGLTMTCASHVQRIGQGFPGQLGCFGDEHLPGLTRLADGIKTSGSLAVVQLHHAGRRAPAELIGEAPVAPCSDGDIDARSMTTAEVEELIEDFVAAAVRCQQAGFDGVELHGAHDYILCEFLNGTFNVRDDRFGGSLENRMRALFAIIEGIRATCRPDFHLSVRLSPERFGQATADIVVVVERLMAGGQVDLVDLSMWDVFKEAVDPEFAGRSLLDVFTGIDRGTTRLGAAGKLYSGDAVQRALDLGVDVVVIGRAAITDHDFPELIRADAHATMRALPVSRDVLRDEGLSVPFIDYMAGWKGFVAE